MLRGISVEVLKSKGHRSSSRKLANFVKKNITFCIFDGAINRHHQDIGHSTATAATTTTMTDLVNNDCVIRHIHVHRESKNKIPNSCP